MLVSMKRPLAMHWPGDRVTIVTHVDLDGVAAGVVVYRAVQAMFGSIDIDTYFIGYSRGVGRRLIESLESQMGHASHVFITDISLRDEKGEPNMSLFLDYVEAHPRTQFLYWDHHKSTDVEALSKRCPENLRWRIEIDESTYRCGTDIAYEELWLDNQVDDLVGAVRAEEIRKLVELAHDYDIAKPDGEWRQDIPQSTDLTDIITIMGPRKVYEILRTLPGYATGYASHSEMWNALQKARKQRELSLDILSQHRTAFVTGGQQVYLGVCAGFYNDACKELVGDDKDGVAIALDLHREGGFSPSLSVRRSTGSTVSCKNIAEKLGGGGHDFAAGGRISKDLLIDAMLKAAADYVSECLSGEAVEIEEVAA